MLFSTCFPRWQVIQETSLRRRSEGYGNKAEFVIDYIADFHTENLPQRKNKSKHSFWLILKDRSWLV